jgi:hypothetical protein
MGTRIGEATVREVRARQAALQYWQGDYAKVLPAQAEPVAAVDESNVELQLVVANAAYRSGLKGVTERTAAIQALTEAANGYLTVLKNNTWHEQAAYNYEYVIRLRDEVTKGRKPPSDQAQQGMELGESGAPVGRHEHQGLPDLCAAAGRREVAGRRRCRQGDRESSQGVIPKVTLETFRFEEPSLLWLLTIPAALLVLWCWRVAVAGPMRGGWSRRACCRFASAITSPAISCSGWRRWSPPRCASWRSPSRRRGSGCHAGPAPIS